MANLSVPFTASELKQHLENERILVHLHQDLELKDDSGHDQHSLIVSHGQNFFSLITNGYSLEVFDLQDSGHSDPTPLLEAYVPAVAIFFIKNFSGYDLQQVEELLRRWLEPHGFSYVVVTSVERDTRAPRTRTAWQDPDLDFENDYFRVYFHAHPQKEPMRRYEVPPIPDDSAGYVTFHDRVLRAAGI